MTVNLTDGLRKNGEIIEKDQIEYPQEKYFIEEKTNTILGCICKIKKCIRKCCGPNEKMVNSSCILDPSYNLQIPIHGGIVPVTNISESGGDFYVIYDRFCEKESTLLYPEFENPEGNDNFYVQTDGSLYLPNFEGSKSLGMVNPEYYCVDVFVNEDMDHQISALLCFQEVEESLPHHSIGMMVKKAQTSYSLQTVFFVVSHVVTL